MQSHKLIIPYSSNNDEYRAFLTSDLHTEDAAFDREFFIREFEGDADIFINGDVFSLILPSDRKRYRRGQDPFVQRDDFINEIVERTYELLRPYAARIRMIGVGNHEAEYIKRTGYDPVSGLITLLQKEGGKPILHGGYEGFIVFNLVREDGNDVKKYTVFYNHGQGGSSEVTQGVISLMRRSYIRADLVWLGHEHRRNAVMLPTEIGVDREGNIYERVRKGVMTGTYLKTFAQNDVGKDGYRGSYGAEKLRVPQMRGGVMLMIRPLKEGAEGKLLI